MCVNASVCLLMNYFPWCNFANAIYQCGIRWWNRCAHAAMLKSWNYIFIIIETVNCSIWCVFWSSLYRSFSLPPCLICCHTLHSVAFVSVTNFFTLSSESQCFWVLPFCHVDVGDCVGMCTEIFCNTQFTQFPELYKFFYTNTKQRSHRFMGIWWLIKYLCS